ncbi:MAG: hypothetical protein A3K19_19840 [Lentisphaerae bacterium RIFOXYB12_FULL_65_16]|nr:MAG: hypothetical protein A3K18_18935 [Lentisphaerae bacterium RIFOXYA12_64_32]OGV85106.1 MAG: hypothetical protein A3K19_19840 [Lentisphaerae bacterium RIFOXYB12_FULL_65_16]
MIAIIAILASMLLPALQGAREKANAIDCNGRLKQMATMWLMYADDHDETLGGAMIYPSTTSYLWWYQVLESYGCDSNLRKCGSAPKQDPGYGFNWRGVGYQINHPTRGKNAVPAAPNPIYDGVKLAKVKHPDVIIMMGDCYDITATQNPLGYAFMLNYLYSEANQFPGMCGRHTYGNNFSYIDGHTRWLPCNQALAAKWFWYD